MRANILATTVTLILTVGFTAPTWCAKTFDTKQEQIDGLRLGLPGKMLAADLSCQQPRMSREAFEGATGLYVQDWGFPACGITLQMVSDSSSILSFFCRDFNKLEIGQSVARGIVVAPSSVAKFQFSVAPHGRQRETSQHPPFKNAHGSRWSQK
jgi:hypothetical protein